MHGLIEAINTNVADAHGISSNSLELQWGSATERTAFVLELKKLKGTEGLFFRQWPEIVLPAYFLIPPSSFASFLFCLVSCFTFEAEILWFIDH